MAFFKSHPLATLGAGIVLGIVFSKQVARVPGVNKIPQV
jgi:hypothetical protein